MNPFISSFKKSLNLWERQGRVRWLEFLPGDEPATAWQNDVKRADLILLLLSPDFFPDELCYQSMHAALRERASRHVPVVPILVRAVNWRLSACRDLAIVPHNEQPIASWTLLDEAYASIGADLVRLVPSWQIEPISLPTRPRLFQARDLPKGYVPRPKAFNAIKRLLLSQRGGQTMAITTALRGTGGFGKTTLALALCHDSEIQAAFPDGILWVELGEQPPRTLDVLNGLLASLETGLREALTLEEAQERWREALQQRVCLLVIDDVWQLTALEPLLEGGTRCIRLVTTRNDQVLPERVQRVLVDAMEVQEAVETLSQGLPAAIRQTSLQPVLKTLVKRLGCWPLLLSLARGMLLSRVQHGQDVSEALRRVEQAYQKRGVMAFRLEHASERQKTVEGCLDVSLRHLDEFVLPHYRAGERYEELAVFPEDTDIPIATLRIYWQGTRRLEAWETEELCISLHGLSLLLTCDLGKGSVRLHDVLRNYLEQRAGLRMAALHERLLNAYWQVLGLRRWADVPTSDTYLWQHLIWHLCRTSRREVLQATLTDLGYLTRKALYVSISALEADLLQASSGEQAETAEITPLLESLHRSIVRVSHLLRQVHTLAEMGGLLLSHIGSEPAFATQRVALEHELPRPFLTVWHPLPGGSSSALLRTLHGHTGSVTGCAVSPDGSFIVSTSADSTLKVWDAATGAERFTLQGHTDKVTGCGVSPDGNFIVSTSWDRTLKVWDAATGAERFSLDGHTSDVFGCVVSPDGRWIVSASADKTLKVWNAATGDERLSLQGHTHNVLGCAVSPDGRWIVSASEDSTLKVWDAATEDNQTMKVWDTTTEAEYLSLDTISLDGHTISLKKGHTISFLKGHTGSVTGCAVSPDGRWIVSASEDCTLKVWDAAKEDEYLSLKGHTGPVFGCAVSPDGNFIVSASRDRTLKVWDATTGVERLSLKGHTGPVFGCSVSPDGRWIVSASDDQTLKVWDAATEAERLSLKGHTGFVFGCAVSPDGSFVVSTSDDETLKVWDAATGAERLSLQGHTRPILDCAVSPDGNFIVSASADQTLKMWDVATGAERLSLQGHTGSVTSCAVSPDGSFIVSASLDSTLKVWDAATGSEQRTLSGHTTRVLGCTVSANGRFIISVSWDHTLKVWDTQTGQCLLTFPVDGTLHGCAFHPDGEHLVACGTQGMYFLRLVV